MRCFASQPPCIGSKTNRLQAVQLFRKDFEQILDVSERAGSALCIHDLLQQNSVVIANQLVERRSLSAPTVNAALSYLNYLGISKDVTCVPRGLVFVYRRYFTILDEDIDPLPCAS